VKHDADVLRRSMDAAPEQWLDRLVAERVVAEVRQQGGTHPTRARVPAVVHRARITLGVWLAKLLPPSAPSWPWRGSNQRG
jgi:hypothetical protein